MKERHCRGQAVEERYTEEGVSGLVEERQRPRKMGWRGVQAGGTA